ncbi:unnamed protein product [Adineta ricciae]|uniref:Uncharacterized protein n=1 Tax=Adineta ricciae TaxID=249248 RepID=A0A815PIK5_ADIRI|nr:unnamed protein product [Adineta ricciae]
MTPTFDVQNSAVSGDDGVARDAAFQALSPFSGAFSPTQVREQMVGPILNGPPTSIWRRTTISHSNVDGSFCFPMARCEPSAAGMGTTRMVARRERRENARNSGYTTTIPQTPVTPSTNSTTTTAAAVIHTSTNETSPQLQQLNLSDEELM